MKRILAVVLPFIVACESPVVCTLEPRWAVELTAVNAVDQTPVTEGLRGNMRDALGDGSRVTEMYLWKEDVLLGAAAAGALVVTVDATGYETWVREDVQVTRGECGVNTVELTAEMTPE